MQQLFKWTPTMPHLTFSFQLGTARYINHMSEGRGWERQLTGSRWLWVNQVVSSLDMAPRENSLNCTYYARLIMSQKAVGGSLLMPVLFMSCHTHCLSLPSTRRYCHIWHTSTCWYIHAARMNGRRKKITHTSLTFKNRTT